MSGAELRELRKNLELTQAKLALKLGIHPITLSKYETDHTAIPHAVDLAVRWITSGEPCSACGTNGEHACPEDLARG